MVGGIAPVNGDAAEYTLIALAAGKMPTPGVAQNCLTPTM